MKNSKTLYFFICLIAYYFIFWEEKPGLNLFLFDLALLTFSYIELPKNKKTLYLIVTGILSALSVILVNTPFAIATNILIMGIVMGYSLIPEINSAISAEFVYFLGIIVNIRHLAAPITSLLKGLAPKSVILDHSLKLLKISILPIIFFVIFLLLFQNANPIFLEKTIFLKNAVEMFIKEFPTFSFERTIFTLFGYFILLGVFFKQKLPFGESYLTNQQVFIENNTETKGNDLYRTAIFSFLGLNALLLSVNFIDIQYLWFNFSEKSAQELSKLVHSGTYLLILSVLISIGILTYFFKGELNFLKKNKVLFSLAFVWIAQNTILIFSVFVRNYKYVEMYGLTHKRIGVYIFLILTLLGLISITLKIIKKLNINFLIISNSWAYMAVFLILSFVNFDKMIAENNLKRPNCDLEYVKSLSTHAIPTILEFHPEIKKEEINSYKWFERESKNLTWLSWNLMDYRLQNIK